MTVKERWWRGQRWRRNVGDDDDDDDKHGGDDDDDKAYDVNEGRRKEEWPAREKKSLSF